jgi:hypothetical protein
MTLDFAAAEDVDTLQKGFFSVLPHDRAGRAVIFFDRRIRAIPAVASRDAVVSTILYDTIRSLLLVLVRRERLIDLTMPFHHYLHITVSITLLHSSKSHGRGNDPTKRIWLHPCYLLCVFGYPWYLKTCWCRNPASFWQAPPLG